MPTLTQLRYIVAVNNLKHFGRAAKECHVSQPSLSAQVKLAEEELGIIIFDRSKKPIMLTDGGRKVVEQAAVVLREHKRLYDLSSEDEAPSGSFHLGVIPTLAPYVIPLFLEKFSEKYPKVSLKISEHMTKDIISKLYDDELDGGLLVTPLYDSRIIERSLFFEPFYVFLSSNHEYYNRKIIKDSELDPGSVWLLDEGHCFREQVIRVCASKHNSQILKNVTFTSGNLETLINLIRRGRGYTLLPHLATLNLTETEKEHNLKRFSHPIPTREVSLVHSRSFLKEKIIQALEQEIILSIPAELKSLKRGNVEVIDI